MLEEKYIQLAMMTKEAFIEYMNQVKIHNQNQEINKKRTTISQLYDDLKEMKDTSFFEKSIAMSILLFLGNLLIIVFFKSRVDKITLRIFQTIGILNLLFVICAIIQNLLLTRQSQQQKQDRYNKIDVLKNGQWQTVKENKLNIGDVFRLKAGDDVPVDARIILAKNLYVSQEVITGNPNPIVKSSILTKTHSKKKCLTAYQTLLFSGSRIITGELEAIVIATKKDSFLTNSFQTSEISQSSQYQTNLEKKFKKYFFDSLGITAILILLFGIRDGDWLNAVSNGVFILMVSFPFLALFFYQQFLYFQSKNWSRLGIQFNKAKNIEIMNEVTALIIDNFNLNVSNQIDLVGCYNSEGKVSNQIYHYALVQSSLYTGDEMFYDQAILNESKNDTICSDYHLLNEKPAMIQPKTYRSITVEDKDFNQYTIHTGPFEAMSDCFAQADSINEEKMIKSCQLLFMKKQIQTFEAKGYHVLTLIVQKKSPFEVSVDESFFLLGYLVFDVNKKAAIEDFIEQNQLSNISSNVFLQQNVAIGNEPKNNSIIKNDVCGSHAIIYFDISNANKHEKIRRVKGTEGKLAYFSFKNPFIKLRQDVDLMIGPAFSWFNQYINFDVSLTMPSIESLFKMINLNKMNMRNAKKYLSKIGSCQLGMLLTLVWVYSVFPELSLTLTQLFLLNIIFSLLFLPFLVRKSSDNYRPQSENDEENSLFPAMWLNVFGNLIFLMSIFVLFFNQNIETVHTMWFLFIIGSQWSTVVYTFIKKTPPKLSEQPLIIMGTLFIAFLCVIIMHPMMRTLFKFSFLTVYEWIAILVSIVIYTIAYSVIDNVVQQTHP